MSQSKNAIYFKFPISSLWLDVMRMREPLEDEDVDDIKWWRAPMSEIQFAFKILIGLGLAKSEPPPQDESEMEKMRQK